MRRAVVSVGTNSTRALVAEFNGTPHVMLTRSTGTRIGEGLKARGRLEEQAMHRTLQALTDHIRAVRELTEDITFIATSALRRAANAEEFTQASQRIVGAPLDIIAGEEEARRSFLGAASALKSPADAMIGVADTGGGSTEYAVGTVRDPQSIVSCEIGAVRLTEEFPELGGTHGSVSAHTMHEARNRARDATAALATFADVAQLLLVGGTATTGIALLRKTRDLFDYAGIRSDEIMEVQQMLARRSLEERKALPGMNPQRADILLGGLIILEILCERTRHKEALVTTNDLLLGTLLVRSLSDKKA